MNFEGQLERIQDKNEIHKWIDEQPLEAEFLVLSCARIKDIAAHRYCCSSELTIASANWMVDVFKHFLQTGTGM